jgi:FkbM family methyltransferase
MMRVELPNGQELRLWSRGDDWVSTQVFWRGLPGFEPEVAPVFFRLAERSPGTVDVGAHVGYFTVMAALANPAARVVAVEPLVPSFARLRRNLALNGLGRVEAINAAAGAEAREAHLFHPPDGLPSAASLDADHLRDLPGVVNSKVRIVRLDDVLAQHGLDRVGLVKIDTETTEPSVLAGALEMLERDRPDIVCEVLPGHETAEPLERLLEPRGYRFYELTTQGPVLRDRIAGNSWPNFLFTARGRATLDW